LGRRRIRGTTSDLGYLPLLQQALPRATHLLDRFHIVKWLNEALKELRRRLFGSAPRDAAGRTLKVQQ
jgi:transposase